MYARPGPCGKSRHFWLACRQDFLRTLAETLEPAPTLIPSKASFNFVSPLFRLDKVQLEPCLTEPRAWEKQGDRKSVV